MKSRKAILMLCFVNIIYCGHSIAQEKIYLNKGDKVRISLLNKTISESDNSFSSRWKRLNTSKYVYVIGYIEDIQNRNVIIVRNKDRFRHTVPKNTIHKFEIYNINKLAVRISTLGGFVIGTLTGMMLIERGKPRMLPAANFSSFSNNNAGLYGTDRAYIGKLSIAGVIVGGIPGAILGYIIGTRMQDVWKEAPLNSIGMSQKISFSFSFSFN